MTLRSLSLLAVMMALTSLLSCGRAETTSDSTVWQGLRSAVIYVRVPEAGVQNEPITVSWAPAWISDSQRERLYWYDPTGKLLQRVEIEKNQPRGNVRLRLPNGSGDYRLVIPGYSFRRYRVSVPNTYKSVMAPEKLHFSMEVDAGQTFWTGALSATTINLKSHRNTAAIDLSAQTGETKTLTHSASLKYRDHNSISLDFGDRQAEITITDGGKFSFWIDGAPNIFAQSAHQWFEPHWRDGEAVFSISSNVIGKTTEIGTYTEFAPLPNGLIQLLRDIRPSIVHSYIFEDVMAKHVARDNANNRALLNLGVEHTYGLLSRTTRDSLPRSTSASVQFLDNYIRRRFAEGLPLHTIAFVDEPNLRYRSYEAYEAYHLALAATIRELNAALNLEIKVAAPESSRMVNGPTNEPRRFQSGIEWTEKLLSRHWDTVDVISWHMWQYRYLETLDQFAETIKDVDALNTRLAREAGSEPKALSISQTNLGSGPNTSTYQQNTHYAALWWASVVAQSVNTGSLDSLIWFKAVDEGPYGKGLMDYRDGKLVRKPIANAMAFINEALLPNTLEAASSAHEVDLAATMSASGDMKLLCVNKSRRTYSVYLDAADKQFEHMELLGADQITRSVRLSEDQQNGLAPISLPAQTICQFH